MGLTGEYILQLKPIKTRASTHEYGNIESVLYIFRGVPHSEVICNNYETEPSVLEREVSFIQRLLVTRFHCKRKIQVGLTSDLHWGKSAVVSNEKVHCYVLAVHMDIDPLANCLGQYVSVLVVVELKRWGGCEREREGGGGGGEREREREISWGRTKEIGGNRTEE